MGKFSNAAVLCRGGFDAGQPYAFSVISARLG